MHPLPKHVTGTVRIRLTQSWGFAMLPNSDQEYGGMRPIPDGCQAQVDIGGADRIDQLTAHQLAAIVARASGIEVIGDTPEGVAHIRDALARAVNR
ncbi:hypothetical protein BX265_2347 [Streptomyces sp. TLI_235]|nr:hypothetical protein BX265_2347 [Streptomyces sp. TLI_235]